jgi:hypothetical protein
MPNKLTEILKATQRFYWKRVASEWRQANRKLNQTDQLYARHLRDAEKKGDRDEIDSLHAEWRSDRELEQDEVDRLTTRRWERRATYHRIPIPPHGHAPYWEQGARGYRLTVEGIDFIENRIYEKRKRRWEFWFQFVPVIAAVAGLIGTLTGLVAVWHHHSNSN